LLFVTERFDFAAGSFPQSQSGRHQSSRNRRRYLAEAHAALGYIKFNYDWDWLDSEREFKRAIQLNANYPSAHSYYARYLNAMGRFSEAVQQVGAAHDLDPLALGINTGMGQSYYFQRDYDRAIQNYEKTLSLEPTFNMARFNLAAALLQKKLTQRSIKEYETAVQADPNDAGTLCEMGQAYAVAGRTGDARRVLAQVLSMASTRYVSAPFISWIYAGLGEKDDAIRQLEKGYQDRAWPMTFLKVDPRYDSLRPDSRFTDLMRRTGFSVGR
jgi:tetratricopeptide (TPR) repeat protein